MFTRMLVPLDGSERAERALSVAARLAQALDSTLVVLRVVQPPLQIATPLAPPLRVETEILSEHIDAANAYLARVARELDQIGLKHERVALVGYPAEMILEAIHSSRADVIILSSHGRTGLMRWALGSVAQRVVHQAPAPVLVLPPEGPTLAEDVQRPLRVLVPLDGSWLAEAALGPAVTLVSALAPQGQGLVHLVQVVRHLPPSSASEKGTSSSPEAKVREARFLEAQDYLSRTAEQLNTGPLAQLKVQVTWSVVIDKDVAGALIDLAQSGKTAQSADYMDRFDVIAMATHGRGGLHRWVMGSDTERVLSVIKLPMLVIRPKEMVITSRFHANPSENEFTLQAQKG